MSYCINHGDKSHPNSGVFDLVCIRFVPLKKESLETS